MAVMIKSASKQLEEEHLIGEAAKRAKKQPRTSDRTDYEHSQQQLHAQGLDIRAHINTKYPDYCEEHPALKTFRASYGYSSEPETQEIKLVQELAERQEDMTLIIKLLKIQETNQEMLYEAEKLCIENPIPWWNAWADELGPYPGTDAGIPNGEE